MKGLTINFIGLLTISVWASACSQQPGVGENMAQCQLDALSGDGMEFRRNYLRGAEPQTDDISFREFMLLCMEAKGHEFQPPNLADPDKENCWLSNDEKQLPDASVYNAKCYSD